MTWLLKISIVSFALAFCVSCGKGSDQTNPVPTPPDPGGGPTEPIPQPPAPIDNRLPDLSKAVPLSLFQQPSRSLYAGLEDIAGTVFLPLVGDPLTVMKILSDRNRVATGDITVAFEDKHGFWAAKLNSFPDTGYRDSSYLDMIFADDELVLRVVGNIAGDDMHGNIFYRIVGRTDQCMIVNICEWVWTGFRWERSCHYAPDMTSKCVNYMNTSSASVKKLGTFDAKMSSWETTH